MPETSEKEQRASKIDEEELTELEKYIHFEQHNVNFDVGGYSGSSCYELSEDSLTRDTEGELFNTPIRTRERFQTPQISILEQVYTKNDHPSRETKDTLAHQFGTSTRRIQIWFQNRRAKSKNDSKSDDRQEKTRKDSYDTVGSDSPETTSQVYLFKNESIQGPSKRKMSGSNIEIEERNKYSMTQEDYQQKATGKDIVNSQKPGNINTDLPPYSYSIEPFMKDVPSINSPSGPPSLLPRITHFPLWDPAEPTSEHTSSNQISSNKFPKERFVNPLLIIGKNEKNKLPSKIKKSKTVQ